MKRAKLIFTLALLGVEAGAVGTMGPLCLKAIRRVMHPTQKTPSEMEVELTDELLMSMETTDGTINPVLRGKTVPDDLAERAHQMGLKDYQLPWDKNLGPQDRRRLLQVGVEGQEFSLSRTLHGIKMPEYLTLEWAQWNAEGEISRSGTLPIKVHLGEVHHATAESMNDVSRVELHLHGTQSAGQVVRTSWKLREKTKELKGEKSPLHTHIVRDLDLVVPRRASELRQVQFLDFKRRAEIAAQMYSVLENVAIYRVENKKSTFFAPMRNSDFGAMIDWVESLARGTADAHYNLDEFKMGFVGLRGPLTYQSPKPIIGLEYRAIHAPDETVPVMRGGNLILKPRRSPRYEENIIQILDGLQATFESKNFGLSSTQIERWLKARPQDQSVRTRLLSSYYLEDLTILKNRIPDEINELVPSDDWLKKWSYLFQESEAYKMLLQDWSADPLFFDKPELSKRILKEQILAVKEIQQGADPHESLQRFLLNSDLLKHFLASTGTYIDPRPTRRR